MCRWVGQSGERESVEGLRASGGWMENGNEGAWGIRNVAGEEGQTVTYLRADKHTLTSPHAHHFCAVLCYGC